VSRTRIRSTSVSVDLGAGTAQDGVFLSGTSGPVGTDTLVNINFVRGSNFDDTLTGSDTTAYVEIFDGRKGNDGIDGRGGIDQVRYDSAAQQGVVVNLQTGTAQDGIFLNGTSGAVGTDTLVNIENVRGSDFNDSITGDGGANSLEGRSGDDSIVGGAGTDTLIGGAGNDTLDGGAITDRLNYTDFNYANYSTSPSAVTIDMRGVFGDGSSGFATVQDGFGFTDKVVNVNIFRGSDFADTILGSKALWFEQFEGGLGNDTIDGGEITDTLLFSNSNRISYQNASGPVSVSLADGFASGAAGKDVFTNINQVRGSEFGDVLTGSDLACHYGIFRRTRGQRHHRRHGWF